MTFKANGYVDASNVFKKILTGRATNGRRTISFARFALFYLPSLAPKFFTARVDM